MIDAAELEQYRSHIYGLCYRMTGVSADAEDLVQETFVRALSSPPADTSREILPWLVRVAMNASRDLLRKRKTRGYQGVWLPSPLDTESLADEGMSQVARYSQIESLSFAFLIALEALSETQRAVLVLRDVLDYSVEETARALDLTHANVKTSHHRARAALEAYEATRPRFDPQERAKLQGVMTRLFLHLALNDVQGARALLADDALALTDGGGEFLAAGRPIVSASLVLKFARKTMEKSPIVRMAPRVFNGLPALALEIRSALPGVARYAVYASALDRTGNVQRLYSVLASRKLVHLQLASDLAHRS